MSFDQIKSLFTLKKLDAAQLSYSGFLYPTDDCEVWSYNYPALEVYMYIVDRGESYNFGATISSIDDSGVTIYCKGESLEKVTKRLENFKQFIEDQSFRAPSRKILTEWCDKNCCYPDYW